VKPCPGALVAGACDRALAVVRSLGRRGIPVWVLQTDEHSLAGHSRFAGAMLRWPRGSDPERRDDLLGLVDQHGLTGWALIATNAEDAVAVARLHPELREYLVLTVSPWELLEPACDKRAMHRFAGALGIAQPLTFFPRDERGLERVKSFPVMLKPAHKAECNELAAAECWRADSREALVSLYHRACRVTDPARLMVQELIAGSGQYSFGALCHDGRVLASVTARRTRHYPFEFGRASTFVETIDDESVARDARMLLAALKLTGIVEVEFKRDPVSGENVLLDLNHGAWGSQSLAAAAGVDFPYLLWQMACDFPVPEVHGRPGVGWMRMLTDLPAAIEATRHGRLSAWGYLKSFQRPLAHATFAADDPLPGLLDPALLGPISVRRLLRTHVV
jgi:D-aspartate ligase